MEKLQYINKYQWFVCLILFLLSVFLIALKNPLSIVLGLVILFVFVLGGIRIIYQYERGVLFTLGRYSGILAPGIVYIIPIIQDLRKIDLRVRALDIPKQEVMTKDNVPVKINAAVFFKVEYPDKAVLNVENFEYATLLYSQTVLRDIIGGVTLDELLQKREEIGEKIRKIVDEITDEWGVKVTGVRLQDIELPEELKRAMARQAEAERERRAIIIKSEGEFKAAENLAKAAEVIAKTPQALYLRLLHTLADISSDPSQKIIVLLPVEILKLLGKDKTE